MKLICVLKKRWALFKFPSIAEPFCFLSTLDRLFNSSTISIIQLLQYVFCHLEKYIIIGVDLSTGDAQSIVLPRTNWYYSYRCIIMLTSYYFDYYWYCYGDYYWYLWSKISDLLICYYIGGVWWMRFSANAIPPELPHRHFSQQFFRRYLIDLRLYSNVGTRKFINFHSKFRFTSFAFSSIRTIGELSFACKFEYHLLLCFWSYHCIL